MELINVAHNRSKRRNSCKHGNAFLSLLVENIDQLTDCQLILKMFILWSYAVIFSMYKFYFRMCHSNTSVYFDAEYPL